MSKKIVKKIQKYSEKERWDKAEQLLLGLLEKDPDDHWVLTKLASTYYEEYNYKKALKYSEKALKIAPSCPLVNWDYACALDMMNRKKEAIKIWKKLLNRKLEDIAFGECGEGIRWSKSLLNDCRYRIGVSYLEMGKNAYALKYLNEHIKNRKRGLPSLYSKKEVLKKVR